MSRVLAFDVGKTGCRVAFFEGERRVAQAEQPGSRGIADTGGVHAALSAMAAAAEQLDFRRVDAVGAGLAGLGQALDRAPALAAALAQRYGTAHVVLASDMTTSHAGALAGGPGVVVAGGTGAVALAVDAVGRSRICDGWGYLLGDDGSGYAIGRTGLASALRHHDGRGGSAALHRLAEARFGPAEGLPAVVHGATNSARAIASFARDVLDAALRGDERACSIWSAAGRSLAETTAAAAVLFDDDVSGDEPFDVAVTGGLFRAGALLCEPFEAELAARLPRAHRRSAAGDALDGARLLAVDDAVPHARLTRRLEAG